MAAIVPVVIGRRRGRRGRRRRARVSRLDSAGEEEEEITAELLARFDLLREASIVGDAAARSS